MIEKTQATAFDHDRNPQMSDDFARVYEEIAHRVTGPISLAALAAAEPIGSETSLLDIAAGAGALSVPAARKGASVLAVDIAPGMVRRLRQRLVGFPECEARVMDGEALDLPDDAFDATFSIFGVMTFTAWRKGLAEQARVTKPNGKACIATWAQPVCSAHLPGGGPFQILFEGLARVFPERPAPKWPDGFAALSDPTRLVSEMAEAGFDEVSVREIESVWEGPSGDAYLDEIRELYGHVRPYVALDDKERGRVDAAMRDLTTERATYGRVRLTSPALLALARGTRRRY